MAQSRLISTLTLIGAAFAATAAAPADDADWTLIRPSNTGIPGELTLWARWDPLDRLWVSARWPFWGEGGVGVTEDPDENIWTTYSNFDTPMPSEWVNAVEFEPDGVAWFGTDEGLVRFDGMNWTIYDTSNSPLPSAQVTDLDFAPDGVLWIIYQRTGYVTQGVAAFDGTGWQIHPFETIGFNSADIGGVAVDGRGDVWVGTAYVGGIARYDGTSWTVYDDRNGYTNAPARQLTVDDDGNLWAIWGGVKRYDGVNWTGMPVLPGNHDYSALAVEPDGTYWLGTYGGYLARHNGGGNFSTWIYGNHLYSIDFGPDGRVWCGGLAQTKRLNPDGSFTVWNTWNTGAPDYFVDDFALMRDGRIWWLTGEAGASLYDGVVWRNFGDHNIGFEFYPFPGNEPVDGVYEDSAGNVWMGGNGIAFSQGGTLDNWRVWNWQNSNLGVGRHGQIAEDWTGRIWCGTDYGLYYLDGDDWIRQPLEGDGSYYGSYVTDVEVNPDQTMWVSTRLYLYRYDGVNWTKFDQNNSGLRGFGVNDIAVGPDGDVWGATSEGLVRFDGSNWTVYDTTNSGLEKDNVWCVDVRDDGLVAAGTFDGLTWPYNGGVSLFDGSTWTTYTRENSPLPHEQIAAVMFDDKGDLWISATSEGVAVLDLDSGDSTISLTQTPLTRGQTATLTVDGAAPGERTYFLMSLTGTGQGPVVPLLGGMRLDLLAPVQRLGEATADDSGTAVIQRLVPANAPLIDVHTQAVIRRGSGGADSVKSNTVTDTIRP